MRGFVWLMMGVMGTVWSGPLPERVKGLTAERVAFRSVGPGGGGWIQSLAWSRHAADRFFVGCDVGGFYYSENGGRTYEMRNRGLSNMFIETIAEHPVNPDVILLGSKGGIFKTTDRGLTWEAKRAGLPPWKAHGYGVQVSKFAFAPGRPDTVYAAAGQPRELKGGHGEVWRSDDGGETWRMVVREGLPKDANVFDITIHTAKPEEILISTDRGVFLSTDGGAVWAASNAGLPGHLRTRRLARCAAAPDTVYVSLRQKGGEKPWAAGVWRSDDGGRTWTERAGGLRREAGKAGARDNYCAWVDCLAVDPRDPETVWAGGASWWYTGVYRTRDGGRTWERVFGNGQQGWLKFWGPTVMCLALSARDPGRVAFGTSGTVYATEDGAGTWEQRYTEARADGLIGSTGLEVTCLHAVEPSRAVKGRFYLGYFDIGLMVTEDGGRTMRRAMAGVPARYVNSCFSAAEAPDDPEHVWAGFGQWGGKGAGCVAESVDGGRTWTASTNAAAGWIDAPPRGLTVLGKKPDYRVLYACGKGLIESADGGRTWRPFDAGVFPAAPRVRALRRDGARLYAAADGTDTEKPAVFACGTDDLTAWRRLTPTDWNAGQIRCVAVMGERILVTARKEWRAATHTTRPGGAWLSADGGRTWKRVWSDDFCGAACVTSKGLFIALQDHPYHDRSVGGGVIHSRDDGATWTYLDGPGLQNWNVSVLAASPFDDSELWLGTGGNSVFVGRVE